MTAEHQAARASRGRADHEVRDPVPVDVPCARDRVTKPVRLAKTLQLANGLPIGTGVDRDFALLAHTSRIRTRSADREVGDAVAIDVTHRRHGVAEEVQGRGTGVQIDLRAAAA